MFSPYSIIPFLSILFLVLSSSSSFTLVLGTKKVQKLLTERQSHQLNKRQSTYHGRATYYNTGLGACGWHNTNRDSIVALNAKQYGDLNSISSWCGKKIAITYHGVTQYAIISDACPSCPYAALDMSPSLFSSLAPLDLGVFQMSWKIINDHQNDTYHHQTKSRKKNSIKLPNTVDHSTLSSSSSSSRFTKSLKKDTTTINTNTNSTNNNS